MSAWYNLIIACFWKFECSDWVKQLIAQLSAQKPRKKNLCILYSCNLMDAHRSINPNHNITHCPSPFTNNRSSEAPSLVGSLTRSVRNLSSRNLLDCFLSSVTSFQQVSGKLKFPTRTRTSDCETSPSCLKNISSASSSWVSGLDSHQDLCLLDLSLDFYP